MSRGPCQVPVYQASNRWPDGPCQKTSWVLPSLVTATAGVEVKVPNWGKPTGPFHEPVYQASASWLVAASFQKTSWVEPSGVTATCGAPTPWGEKTCGPGASTHAPCALLQTFCTVYASPSPPVTDPSMPLQRSAASPLFCTSYQASGGPGVSAGANPTSGSVIASASSCEETAVTFWNSLPEPQFVLMPSVVKSGRTL